MDYFGFVEEEDLWNFNNTNGSYNDTIGEEPLYDPPVGFRAV